MFISFFILIIAIALIFDLVNGFHDAANSIATVVSTRVLSPLTAVLWAACFNFLAMLVFAPKVANTISQVVKVEYNEWNYLFVVLAALLSAILWNILTWAFGLPTSSSHALVGGLAGAGVAYGGWTEVRWDMLFETVIFIVLAPAIGFCLGSLLMLVLYWIFRDWHPHRVSNFFQKGQLFSAAMYSIGHGANDAQKTMGIIMALMVAGGFFSEGVELSLGSSDTRWIILSCQAAMALGTAFGGWRIVKTMGMKLVKLKPIGGFCAETSGAVTLFFATHLGVPVSTTHTITGSIVGVGCISESLTRIKWGIAGNVIWAWVLTMPFTFLLAAGFFYVFRTISEAVGM